ncbi:MAG: hypothetical protein FJ387_21695 [Verrucomicrobia bacterium]|nr:hypothetical protein [Verrucomicrobiota bacterium]
MKLATPTIAILLATAGHVAFAADSALSAKPTQHPTEWTIALGNRTLLVYAIAPGTFKPYVKELGTVHGVNLLRDAPHDHLHHHALMYGIRVNGLNFWEETAGCGVQKPIATSPPELGHSPQGLPQARLRQLVHWLDPEDAFLPDTSRAALLVEQRTLTLTVHEPEQQVALHWKSEFQVGSKTNQVALTGANYHGLGLRFRQDLDPLAAHLNAGGPPDLSNNRQDVTPHPWGAVAFDRPGQPATLALFGHPSNARGDAHFFTMRTPFAYLSATQALDREPLVYCSGDRFQLNYLITVHAALLSREALERQARRWRESQP